MAAVKNVGEGPVQVIIDARQEGGPFTSLEDFCDRVDLRQVNKRALECLIKVGALDRFGHRSQLLDVLDNIVGQSAAIHSARESGQLSMFELMGDSDAGHAAPIHLPESGAGIGTGPAPVGKGTAGRLRHEPSAATHQRRSPQRGHLPMQ